MVRSVATTWRWCRSSPRRRRPHRRPPQSPGRGAPGLRTGAAGRQQGRDERLPRAAPGRVLCQSRQDRACQDGRRGSPRRGSREGAGPPNRSGARLAAEAAQNAPSLKGRRGRKGRPSRRGWPPNKPIRRRCSRTDLPQRKSWLPVPPMTANPQPLSVLRPRRRPQGNAPATNLAALTPGRRPGRYHQIGADRVAPGRLPLRARRWPMERGVAALADAVQPQCRHQARRQAGKPRHARCNQAQAGPGLSAGLRARLQGRWRPLQPRSSVRKARS